MFSEIFTFFVIFYVLYNCLMKVCLCSILRKEPSWFLQRIFEINITVKGGSTSYVVFEQFEWFQAVMSFLNSLSVFEQLESCEQFCCFFGS